MALATKPMSHNANIVICGPHENYRIRMKHHELIENEVRVNTTKDDSKAVQKIQMLFSSRKYILLPQKKKFYSK
jgi:hypothetical protein